MKNRMKRFSSFFFIFLILITSSLSINSVQADRGTIPIADVDVYGPGQKAIIAWNGETERIILSTDLYSSANTKVLEVIPLPSKPSVEEGSFESFQAVQELVIGNMPRVATPGYKELEIVFHEKIGAHDITVVRATSLKELVDFAHDYAWKMMLGNSIPITENTKRVLEDYLTRSFNYWVFDLVDLASKMRSIEPIVYEFQSSSLYYPMKISSTAIGYTRIILYLITPEAIKEDSIPSKMQIARYSPSDQIIQFQVSHKELEMIDKGISLLFGPIPLVYPQPPAAWLTTIKYEGDLSDLDFDLGIHPPIPEPIKCRSIKVNTNKAQYDLGEAVEINIHYVHLLPGCAEIQVLHYHEIRLEILDEDGNEVYNWAHRTQEDFYETIFWTPKKQGVYTITASSWWNGEKLEVSDEASVQVVSPKHPEPSIEPIDPFRWILYGAILATVCILVGIVIAYFLLEKRS